MKFWHLETIGPELLFTILRLREQLLVYIYAKHAEKSKGSRKSAIVSSTELAYRTSRLRTIPSGTRALLRRHSRRKD